MELDTIIIGSGAGGLSAALCLARAGQNVIVLEQHSVPGGWCHSFYLEGHRFSPGVHYIGMLEEGQSTSNLYRGLGIANDLVFFKMNPKAYEHCWIGDERIDMPAGYDELFEVLVKRFPHEKKGLAKYLKTVNQVSRELGLIAEMDSFKDNLTIAYRTRHMGKYGLFNLRRVIDWHIKDPLLKKVLNVQCGDHGLPPSKASFPVHCAVMDHYSEGGFYPMGGGASIVKAMTNSIKKYGGEVRTNQSVKRILLEGDQKKRAIGVELESGEQIFAKQIISNADPDQTYLKMIGKSNLSKKLLKRLSKTKYSCTSLMLFITLDMDVRAAGLDSGNIWMMSDKGEKNLDELYEEMFVVDLAKGDEFPGLFISCPTLKDPTSFDGYHHTMEIVTFINYEAFRRFENDEGYQSAEYLKYKERLTEKMLNGLEKVLPGVRNHIVQKQLGTPMTNTHYVNTTDGCVYGTEKSLKQIGPFAFKPKSEFENLYLCGASIVSHGVAGATYSGVETAAEILQCKRKDLLKPAENQHVRVYSAEDHSDFPEWMQQKIKVRKARAESKFEYNVPS
ncbi:MAG: NAD(P)/FAD-dependent oxidoreductase [Flavobacteriales bacterium]|nr:NAD(P)/FAD-dependent oxidoreductase [Flavobacteriales bacterium]